MPEITLKALVAAVKAHAERCYSKGWDEVVEAWEDDEIAEVVRRCTTIDGAIRKMSEIVGLRNERAAEIRATAF